MCPSGSLVGSPWEERKGSEQGVRAGLRGCGGCCQPQAAAQLPPSTVTPGLPLLQPPAHQGHGAGAPRRQQHLLVPLLCHSLPGTPRCQGKGAATAAVQPPTAPTARGCARKQVSQPSEHPQGAASPSRPPPVHASRQKRWAQKGEGNLQGGRLFSAPPVQAESRGLAGLILIIRLRNYYY